MSHSNIHQSPVTSHQNGPRGRQRAKKACEVCKTRKRKCDGRDPCGYCVCYEYHCSYGPNTRKRASHLISASPSDGGDVRTDMSKRSEPDTFNQKHMEANSGIAFPHVLGMRFNPSDAPRVHGFSWNLGLRGEPVHQYANITHLVTVDEMNALADVFFEKIHPLYAFLDPDTVRRKITDRWRDPDTADSYDTVLCTAAALGSLYCGNVGHPHELDLIQLARKMLETTSTMKKPLLHHVAAWLLQTIYLRSNNSPHASWMASCMTMHIMEATGSHQDPSLMSVVYTDTADTSVSEESQRRLFWVATILNAWISYEYGRSRVIIQGVSCKPPSSREGDLTADLIRLYQISQLLDPGQVNTAPDLEDSLARVESLEFAHDALVLSQSNLALTIYRRLRLASSNIPNESLERIIRLGRRGLEAAVQQARELCPWWHVVNVPFQFVCILLAIDTGESLSHVGHAMRSLKIICEHFNTPTIQRAMETAELLVRLAQRRKKRDTELLNNGLQGPETPVSCPDQASPTSSSSFAVNPGNEGAELAFFGNFIAPDGLEWDWDAFLGAEIPVLDDPWLRSRQ